MQPGEKQLGKMQLGELQHFNTTPLGEMQPGEMQFGEMQLSLFFQLNIIISFKIIIIYIFTYDCIEYLKNVWLYLKKFIQLITKCTIAKCMTLL